MPDAALASRYLHDLFDTSPAPQANPASLLIEIVADLAKGAGEIVIPLSGGRDSRALLGAALHCFPAKRIHCLTFGPDGSDDVEGARVACRSAGVSHEVIHPNDFEWDLEALTAEMKYRLESGMGIPPIDGMLVFGKLAERVPEGLPVLSGYLGDATIGRHLEGETLDEEDSSALRSFYSQHRGPLEVRPDAMFREFLKSHEPLRASWPGLSKLDLLDLGFAQRLRFRSSVTGSFQKPVRVYEDRRWVAHWFAQPLAKRMSQAHYDEILAASFPWVFGRLPLPARVSRWRARRRGRRTYRGDPRQNPSMAAALEEACRSFDSRGLATGHSAMAAFRKLIRDPSLPRFRTVRWFATAEIVVRASKEMQVSYSPIGAIASAAL
ncbi:MAG TPA: asparagine synthase-related protein [Sphingomicrobium sp.]|nr:asparagine synthase-related protein [Sphingomicrobium sp.]